VVEQLMTNDLVLVDPDGGDWSCVLCGVPDTGFGDLGADGTVVVRRLINGTPRLVVREPGQPERVLTAEDEEASCPSISPDGERVAYLVARPGVGFELRVVSRAGGSPVTLAAGVEGSEYPSWSPDGRFIAYAAGSPVRVWAVPVVGGRARPVSPVGGDYPEWSPDGRWIAYVVWTESGDPNQGAWVIDAEGGQPIKMSDRPTRVAWDRSGRQLRQLRRSEGALELWQAEVGSRHWTLRGRLDIGAEVPAHQEFLPLSVDPRSDRLLINRRSSISTVLVFSGIDPETW
jgi:WD40 repeat protein